MFFRDFITKALDHLLLLVSALRVNPGNSRGVQIGCKRGTKLVHSHRPTRSRNQDYPLTGPRPGASPTIYVRKNTPKHFPKRHGSFFPRYAKVVELEKTLRVEQVTKEWLRVDTHEESCSRSMTGKERRLWERGGRWEEGRDCHTIRTPTNDSTGHR